MKPELLLPAGNIEAFFAALEGGADAIYLGLRDFNARNRARNFSIGQLAAMIKIAHEQSVKIYLTLNTLIKNSELPALLDALHVASRLGVDAIIIQDLGVYLLATRFFPKLAIHASTQMGLHNSLGARCAKQMNFERAILARELTLAELKMIAERSEIELEIFAHGALCYSFSGMCLFSSYLGGMSANRGQCRQPCRRVYEYAKGESFLFSLKDNQVMEFLPQLLRLPIRSIKIEGRMKSAEYVHTVASAYRMALDDPTRIPEALELLHFDMGRSKTRYFLGGSVASALSENPYSGVYLGMVKNVDASSVTFSSTLNIEPGFRIRIMPQEGRDAMSLKLRDFLQDDNLVRIEKPQGDVQKGDKVFLVGRDTVKFSSKIQEEQIDFNPTLHPQQKQAMLTGILPHARKSNEQLFVRIDSVDWIRKLNMNQLHGVILHLSLSQCQKLNNMRAFINKFGHKLILEFPRFISELELENYRDMVMQVSDLGIRHFMVSHISQKLLVPPSNRFKTSANEWVYTLNDAAVTLLNQQDFTYHIYPQENDYPNLITGNDRVGIVPLYYYPSLFYSRMPVAAQPGEVIRDMKYEFEMRKENRMTVVTPTKPTSLFQYKSKLRNKGFSRFLIDLSYTRASSNVLKRLLSSYQSERTEQPSSTFNFKKGLS
jgi:putative protease